VAVKKEKKPTELKPVEPLIPKKEKAKRNYSEETIKASTERLRLAREKKREMVEIKRQKQAEEEAIFLAEKENKIMMEAEKLKKKRDKELNAISTKPVTKALPVKAKPKKKPIVVYMDSESEEESEESEEEDVVYIKKPKKKIPVKKEVALQNRNIQPEAKIDWKFY
jgi:hypothetical protein